MRKENHDLLEYEYTSEPERDEERGLIRFPCPVYVETNGVKVLLAHANILISDSNLPFLKRNRPFYSYPPEH